MTTRHLDPHFESYEGMVSSDIMYPIWNDKFSISSLKDMTDHLIQDFCSSEYKILLPYL